MSIHSFLLIGLTSVSAMCLFPISSHGSTDAWLELLEKAKLISTQVKPDPEVRELFGQGRHRGTFQEILIQSPLRVPAFARLFRDQMLQTKGTPQLVLTQALSKIDLAPRRGLIGDPLAQIEKSSTETDALFHVITKIHTWNKKPLSTISSAELKKKTRAVPPELARTVAYLLEAELNAVQARDQAFAPLIVDKKLKNAFLEKTRRVDREGEDDLRPASPLMTTLLPLIDWRTFWVAGFDLMLAVQSARAKIAAMTGELQVSFKHATPLGEIVIRGTRTDDRYDSKPYLLIVDLGGNDTYFSGGATLTENNPTSILIDRSGNDRYLAHAKLVDRSPLDLEERKLAQIEPSWGSGVFGYGILVDELGDDFYRGFRLSGGTAEFGLGVLLDGSGDDRYECHERCQGYGSVGVGLLIDQTGSDHYVALQSAQGVGATRGTGILLDLGTQDDRYLTHHSSVDFPSPIDPKFNVSLVQGAAVGHRADFIDQNSFAGGAGALFDEGGNNEFTADFFAQGVAYWYGLGILSTGKGNDRFMSGKYAAGAGVHYGVGVLHDLGGDDQYSVVQELGLGEGHDFGLGVFVDDSGNDQYSCANLALGAASAQGVGVFWDRSGDDLYRSSGKEILGGVAARIGSPSFRDRAKTIGLFLDTGGKNKFETPLSKLNQVQKSGSWRNVAENESNPRVFFHGAGLVIQEPDTEEPDLIGEKDSD